MPFFCAMWSMVTQFVFSDSRFRNILYLAIVSLGKNHTSHGLKLPSHDLNVQRGSRCLQKLPTV